MNDIDAKITRAQERIESLYNETAGKCYLSFSGGKDSMVILALIKQCEYILTIPPGAIPAVFVNTGIELGATTEFVRWVKENWYRNVQIISHEKRNSFDWILKNKGKPIKSKGCPFAGKNLASSLKALYDYEPLRYKAAMHWLKDVYIAQDVRLPFDSSYELERKKKWEEMYGRMRYEMIKKYRPEKLKKFDYSQLELF